jgi:hypothetical protein
MTVSAFVCPADRAAGSATNETLRLRDTPPLQDVADRLRVILRRRVLQQQLVEDVADVVASKPSNTIPAFRMPGSIPTTTSQTGPELGAPTAPGRRTARTPGRSARRHQRTRRTHGPTPNVRQVTERVCCDRRLVQRRVVVDRPADDRDIRASRFFQIDRRTYAVFVSNGVIANISCPPYRTRRIRPSSRCFFGGGSSYATQCRRAPPRVDGSCLYVLNVIVDPFANDSCIRAPLNAFPHDPPLNADLRAPLLERRLETSRRSCPRSGRRSSRPSAAHTASSASSSGGSRSFGSASRSAHTVRIVLLPNWFAANAATTGSSRLDELIGSA